MNSKDREKLLGQFDKLARTYVEDTFKFVMSKMTTSSFTASRDRVLKSISMCRALGFDWPENMEEEYIEKVREEFKRVLRIEEMRLEQQRIKEQIREEQKALRELEALKKKEEQIRKEQETAERVRDEMRRTIEEALARANGEHTAQILEMEKALAEKDKEIEAKQQEIEDSQRAISNAQITKAGHVYVLSNIGSFGENVFKIGMTRRTRTIHRVTRTSKNNFRPGSGYAGLISATPQPVEFARFASMNYNAHYQRPQIRHFIAKVAVWRFSFQRHLVYCVCRSISTPICQPLKQVI